MLVDCNLLVARKIKTLRKQNGWSQAELAERAHLGLRTIQRLERAGQASSSTLRSTACALRIPLSELTRGLGESVTTAKRHNGARLLRLNLSLLCLPTFFLLYNLAVYQFQLFEAPKLHDLIKNSALLVYALNSVLPFGFLLSFVAVFVLNVRAIVILGCETTNGVRQIISVRFVTDKTALISLGLMVTLASSMLAYAVGENLQHWIGAS